MVKNYKNKLKTYASLAAGLGIVSSLDNTAEAQIAYTNINPDSLMNVDEDYVEIDFNNDATIDMTIRMERDFSVTYSYSWSYVYITGSNDIIEYTSNTNRAERLDFGAVIGSAQSYDNDSYTSIFNAFSGTTSDFTGMTDGSGTPWVEGSTDKFLGVRFMIGANTHYGWVKLSVNNTFTVTVKEFAYNTVAAASIQAGQTTTTGIANTSKEEESKIILNGNTLSLNDMTQTGNVIMVSSNGSQVLNASVSKGNNQYSLTGITPGLYTVKANFGEKVIIKKLIVN